VVSGQFGHKMAYNVNPDSNSSCCTNENARAFILCVKCLGFECFSWLSVTEENLDSLNLLPTLYVKVQICQNNKLYDESRVNLPQC
jgi:hypothetical protein